MKLSQLYSYFNIFISDLAPDGSEHTSPEIRQARTIGLEPLLKSTPVAICHRHTGHEILVCTHGSGRVTVGESHGEEFSLIPGQILLIPGGNLHHCEAIEHFCTFGFEFSPGFFEMIADEDPLAQRLTHPDGSVPARLLHDPSAVKSFQAYFEEAQAAIGQADDLVPLVRHSFGQLVAVAMLRLLRQESAPDVENPTLMRVLTVKTWIDRHLFEPVTLEELATMSNLSVSRFCVVFRDLVGASPKHYRLTRRLQHAEYLLTESAYSLSAIARMIGFTDLASFHHAFKQHGRISPSAFRKRAGGEEEK